MWNTGCNVIFNRTVKRLLHIVDGEDPARTLTIAPQDELSFKGTIIPWADRDDEVVTKGFKVHYFGQNRMNGWIYVFQDYRSDVVCWADWTSPSPYVDGKANNAGFKASYVDIQIGIKADDEGNVTLPDVEITKVS